MKPTQSRMALLVLFGVVLAGFPPASRAPLARANGVEPPLVEPTAIHSINGVLDATFVLDEGSATIASQLVDNVWTFRIGLNGGPNYPGPTLYVNPGDTLRLRYISHLDTQNTNLHTHGLHVSPLGNSDNVLLDIPPGAENQFEIKIPTNHPDGLYWYHPHKHGSVDPQIYMGLAGLLVIGRPDSGPTELNGLPQRLLALQYSYSPGNTLVSDTNIPINVDNNGHAFFTDLPNLHFTVNGQQNPRIDIHPGEAQVWNLGNISNNGYFDVRIRGTNGAADQPFVIVAQDGNPYRTPVVVPAGKPLLIPPAARFSLLVQGPPAGTYQLITEYWDDGFFQWPPSFNGPNGYEDGYPLATIESAGPAMPPFPVPKQLSPPSDLFVPLQNRKVDFNRTAVFTIAFPAFLINGGEFPENPVFQPRLNTVEQWDLVDASGAQHPFHIHVNDFQIQSLFDPTTPQNNIRTPQPFNQDIVNLPFQNAAGTQNGEVLIRMNPIDFLGTYVYHCHRVDHEDSGMMALVTILPQIPIYATANGPRATIYNGLNDQVVATVGGARTGPITPVRVAVGDVNFDAVMDLITVTAVTGIPRVQVWSGKSGFKTKIMDFQPFDHSIRGGLNVAAGDISSDGYDDVIVAPAADGPPEVRIFSGKDGSSLGSFMAYESGFIGGVTLASAIVRDGGRYSIVTGPGPGRSPEIRVFDVDWYGQSVTAQACPCCGSGGCDCAAAAGHCCCSSGSCAVNTSSCCCALPRTAGFAGAKPIVQSAATLAYEANYGQGVNVGAGIVDGENGGFQSVLTAPNGNHSPLVKTFVVAGPGHHSQGGQHAHAAGPVTITEMASFLAYPGTQTGPLSVSAVSTPTAADLLVTQSANSAAPLRRFRYNKDQKVFVLVKQFNAGSGFGGGVLVSGK